MEHAVVSAATQENEALTLGYVEPLTADVVVASHEQPPLTVSPKTVPETV